MGTWINIRNKLTLNKQGDNHTLANIGSTIGTVMDTDDPLQMGRLRIFCPDLNDDPKKIQHLPWAVYVAPFGGSIRNSCHTKGHPHPDIDTNTSDGVTQYGFWAIPEKGANVLVTCINGDPRRRVWMGCLYEQQEVGGLFHGAYDWDSDEGKPDGPLSAPEPDFDGDDTKNRIQPLYDNLTKTFTTDDEDNEPRKSAEWKTRGADYPGMVNVDIDKKGTHEELSDNESDEWVKDKLGALGYDWTAFKKLGAYFASKVIGFMSPGLHSISLDDRPFNSRIKLRTTAGHQIILDDTNERIYINTYEGKSWIELDRSGNIDMYGERRISIHSEKDLNLSSNETVRIKGDKGVHIYSGDKTGQEELRYTPKDGEIRLHAAHDIHMLSERTYRQYAAADTKIESRGITHLTTHELFVHATPSSEYLDEGIGGGIYLMGDNEVYIKNPINTISLTPTIGVQLATNLNILLNAGQEIVQVSNLGLVVDNLCSGGLPLQSSNPMVLDTMGETMPYGISLGDIGCEVPTGSALFKIDSGGDITMQTVTDTLITRGTDALGNKFSTSIKSINDTHDAFQEKYNETVSSIQESLIQTEVWQLAIQAAALVGQVNAEAGMALQYVALITSPPDLEDLAGGFITHVIGMFPTPDLMLPDLCMPLAELQVTAAYDTVGFIEDDYFDVGLFSLAKTDVTLMGSDLKFGVGAESGTCHSSLSDIEFAVWPSRVPAHEPWPRVLKQDKGDVQNIANDGSVNNVDRIDQYTNKGEDGRKDIGKVEGKDTITRGDFWRR